MKIMNTKRLIEICETIAADVENDAQQFDGKPFTGKTVGEYMGYHGAAIKALADVLKEILSQTKQHETGNSQPKTDNNDRQD